MKYSSPLRLATLALALTACSRGDSAKTGNRGGSVDLTGAGATFPYPLYSKWFSDYATKTGVRINYQSIGSGGGIRQVSEGTVDFGASDGPMSDDELRRAKHGRILHLPMVGGAIAITYNLPAASQRLRFDGATISDIFLGRIKKWNSPRIAALNPGIALPADDILVVHRSDGSGTTYVFTDYLTKVSRDWAAGPGRGKEVAWPTGLGAKGNEGVAGQVKQTPGAIGYVELAYATQNRLSVGEVANAAGRFVTPSIETIRAAMAGAAANLPEDTDFRISIANAPGDDAYPIASFTWILAYEEQRDPVKGRKLADFLRWALTEGDPQAIALHYAPLPENMKRRVIARLDSLRIGSGA